MSPRSFFGTLSRAQRSRRRTPIDPLPRRTRSGLTPYLATLAGASVLLSAGLATSVGCGTDERPTAAASRAGLPRGPLFVEAGPETGLVFEHANGMTGEHYMVENMGAGAALFDYDGDGDLDAYLVQGNAIDGAPDPEVTDRLFRNDLEVGPDGGRRLRFTDVTAEAGIRATGYGMGVTAGDYDGDGHTDLYVTNWGPNQLLRNRGDGTFTDVTRRAGVDDVRWSVPALFFDFDADGDLDLFVGNYVEFGLDRHRTCRTLTGAPDYCDPRAFADVPDRLFRNRGDGTFEDVTAGAGLDAAFGKALGAVAADLDGSGTLDLYVANDQTANQLWTNRGDGTFLDRAMYGGAAVNVFGRPEASMGVDVADHEGDGDLDLFMTHFDDETNTLYANDGNGLFQDRSRSSGLGAPSLPYTGFGTAWFDADVDGRPDLFVANGAVRADETLAQAGDPYPLHQPNQLFLQTGDGRYRDASARGGHHFSRSEVSRGAAFGDVDNDGDTDVLVTNNHGPARLLLNAGDPGREWLGLVLVTGAAPRHALGARVEIHRPGAPPMLRRVHADGSYASASDPRVLVHLGGADAPGGGSVTVRVRWVDGTVEEWPEVPPGRYTVLERGSGRPVEGS